MLKNHFEGRPGERKVRNGQFIILSSKIPGHRITPEEWRKLVFPGSEVQMSVVLAKLHRVDAHCLRPGCLGVPMSPFSGVEDILEWYVNYQGLDCAVFC
jgi:hypothetical protein